MQVVAARMLWLLSAAMGMFLIAQPISVQAQLAICVSALGLATVIYALRLSSGLARFAFLALATAVVLRYAFWRTTATLPSPDDLVSFIPAVLLYCAEMYCIVMLFMNLFVTSDPLERKQAPQLADDELPTVDVFVPSYNESAEILSLTLSSAKALDYPAHLFNVYLLDDGGTDQKRNSRDPKAAAAANRRHADLQRLCADLGVTYRTRAQNVHAKAGNLNAGLEGTSGELIVVFDADHAPTKEFLRETVGYFRREPKLFLVQTPHFFSNPDPIERNLGTFDRMPSENEMFYGSIQKGLDKWNATFFCGSAAVLRRRALEQVGGFSGVTITEDCETALELHSRGWKSVYVDKPMVTGLQPETLASFIGQRSRWCRGMIQIFILKSPLWRSGLTAAQKICYLSSSMGWFFPLSRMTFLVAPLLFIFFNLKIYDVSTEEFFAYTLTYLVTNTLIRNYLYGSLRWPWVSEIYEYVQSVYLFRAVLSVIFNPRRPSFNVTDKGATLAEDRLSDLATPYFVIFTVLAAALATSIYRYETEPQVGGILLVVAAWNVVNLLIAGAALGVVTERRERRQTPRVVAARLARLVAGDHQISVCVEDTSLAGAKVKALDVMPDIRGLQDVALEVLADDQTTVVGRIPVEVRSTFEWEGQYTLGLQYKASVRHYGLISNLMMADMIPIRAERAARRRPRGLVFGGLTIVRWGLRYPFRAFRHLVFDRNPTEAAARKPAAAPVAKTN